MCVCVVVVVVVVLVQSWPVVYVAGAARIQVGAGLGCCKWFPSMAGCLSAVCVRCSYVPSVCVLVRQSFECLCPCPTEFRVSSSSVMLYVHRDHKRLGMESPGGPPRLSHSS